MMSARENVKLADISLRQAAIVAGFSLLIMTILAPIANFIGYHNLIMPGNAEKTASNIIASEGLFRVSICIFLVVAILDVVVAWALYILLKPVNKILSLLSAWLRLVYAAIFGIALFNLLNVLQLLSGAEYLKAFKPDQLHAQVLIFMNGFNNGWDIGLVFFGLHLLILGYLIFKSGYFPKILGILVIIASLGYITDSFGRFLSPKYHLSIVMYTFVGEVLLIFWLFWNGIRGFGKKVEMP
jgi:hypothetical protein